MSELSQLPVSPAEKTPLVKLLFGGFFRGVIVAAILFWCLEAWIGFSTGHYDSFVDGLANPGDPDMEYRVIATITFLLLGMAASGFVGRLKEAKLGLQTSQAWLKLMSDASFEGLFISGSCCTSAPRPLRRTAAIS
ncbi:MAG: hypothetical protein O6844_05045 [Gammaproteobacteria bacterium]|nr:hypothetical protein [Gammaproteobacteria bacterium]